MATFALTPAAHEDGNFLDFAQKAHKEIYNSSCKKLSDDEFDCVEADLNDFMNMLSMRADEFGWRERIMQVPITEPGDPNPREADLLVDHANATIEQVRAHEPTYIDDESRARQDMFCLYKCLMSSLSLVGRAKVHTDKEKYIVQDALGQDQYSGNLLLKVILEKSVVDNRSGAFAIRMELAALSDLIANVNFDISKFNLRVKTLVNDLARRGESETTLSFQLFRAYKSVPVAAFTTFIDRIKDEQDEKNEDEKDSDMYVMDKAENKFRVLTKEGTWKVEEKDSDRILALETKLTKKLNEIKKLKTSKNRTHRGGDRERSKKRAKSKVDVTRKPKGDLSKPVIINGDSWWWCSPETGGKCTGVLRKHKPSDCKGWAYLKDKKANDKKDSADKKEDGTSQAASLKAQETAIARSASSDSEE